MQHDGYQDGLAVHRRAEELRDGHLLLPHHLLTLLPHLLHVGTHFVSAPQFHQDWKAVTKNKLPVGLRKLLCGSSMCSLILSQHERSDGPSARLCVCTCVYH